VGVAGSKEHCIIVGLLLSRFTIEVAENTFIDLRL
jgi:hypothetical protein